MQPMTDPRFVMEFQDRLALALRRSGQSVQEIADGIQVHRNTVSAWINGRNRPRARDLKAFAMATGYPASWLETGETPPPSGDGGGADGWAPRGSNPRPAD